jgi:hypothetical protein
MMIEIVFRTGSRSTYVVTAPDGAYERALASSLRHGPFLRLFDQAPKIMHYWNGQGATLPSSENEVTDRAAAREAVVAGLEAGWMPLPRVPLARAEG